MTLRRPPDDWRKLEYFPERVLKANLPLSRIHRSVNGTMYFATDADGRWNPGDADSPWGTCYLSTQPLGAALEVFGRFAIIKQAEFDLRVLATVYLSSDVRLADVTAPRALGFGLTAEASAGDDHSTYPITQAWAARLRDAGFAGIYYAARHDPALSSRSVALFGKVPGEDAAAPEAEWAEDTMVQVEPIPVALRDTLRDGYGVAIISGGPTL